VTLFYTETASGRTKNFRQILEFWNLLLHKRTLKRGYLDEGGRVNNGDGCLGSQVCLARRNANRCNINVWNSKDPE